MKTRSAPDRLAASAAWPSTGFGSELAPDIMVPEQFAAPAATQRLDRPEVRLMIAILEEALTTYQRCAAGGRDRARSMYEVERWISSDDPSWLFSFVNICEVLGVVPGQVREAIERWRRAQGETVLLRHRYPYRRVAGTRDVVTPRDARRSEPHSAVATGGTTARPQHGGEPGCEPSRVWC